MSQILIYKPLNYYLETTLTNGERKPTELPLMSFSGNTKKEKRHEGKINYRIIAGDVTVS